MNRCLFVLLAGWAGGCTAPPPAAPVSTVATMPAGPSTWRAFAKLVPEKSAAVCRPGAGLFAFNLRDDTLIVTPRVGDAFATPVASDGSVKHAWTIAAQPPRFVKLELTGNARTRQLEIRNRERGCRFTLVTPPANLADDEAGDGTD